MKDNGLMRQQGKRIEHLMKAHPEELPAIRDEEQYVERPLTQKELAWEIGVTDRHLNSIINGRKDLTEDLSKRITDYYNKKIPDEKEKIRWQWLCCQDEYPTEAAHEQAILKAVTEKYTDQYSSYVYLRATIRDTLKRLGFTIVQDDEAETVANDNTRTIRCTEAQARELEKELKSYATYLVYKLAVDTVVAEREAEKIAPGED